MTIMITKTYSKKRSFAHDPIELPSKIQRIASASASASPPVEDRSSSPLRSDLQPLQTRSSSPLPLDSNRQSTPPTSPIPSSPRGRSTEPACLRELNLNIASRARIRTLKPTKSRQTPVFHSKRFTQLTIDLGNSARRKCKTCGMEYYPATPEDAALHQKFHAQNLGGVDVSRANLLSAQQRGGTVRIYLSTHRGQGSTSDRSQILSIDRRSGLSLKRLAEKVLSVVEVELGAIGIAPDQLWSPIGDNDTSEALGRSRSSRYQVHLFIQRNKCVGLCLAERISQGFRVLPSSTEDRDPEKKIDVSASSSISIGTESVPSLLGVSRIWVSQSARKQGIATALLDHALSQASLGSVLQKDCVAFSQPTESGGKLARRWFGMESGWLVYVD